MSPQINHLPSGTWAITLCRVFRSSAWRGNGPNAGLTTPDGIFIPSVTFGEVPKRGLPVLNVSNRLHGFSKTCGRV
jgi:hypothetical protein